MIQQPIDQPSLNWLQIKIRHTQIELRHRYGKYSEKSWGWLANHLPSKLAYWATIRVGVHATTGQYSDQVVPELTFLEALERWSKK